MDGLHTRDSGPVDPHVLSVVQVAVTVPVGRNPSLHLKLTSEPTVLPETDVILPFTGGLGASHLTGIIFV